MLLDQEIDLDAVIRSPVAVVRDRAHGDVDVARHGFARFLEVAAARCGELSDEALGLNPLAHIRFRVIAQQDPRVLVFASSFAMTTVASDIPGSAARVPLSSTSSQGF
jgi:hypothetical protein